MSDANRQREEEQIRTFVRTTGTDRATARRFLEEAVWNLELAASNFYSSDQVLKSSYNPTPPTKKRKQDSDRIISFSSLRDEGNQSQRDEKYYAGGKSSGIQVQGNPSDKPRGVVDSIFQKESDPIPEAEAAPKSFGTGYRLGSSLNAPVQAVKDRSAPEEPDEPITITFWNQGFTIGEGPLRRYDEPQNQSFLQDIDKGIVPRELQSRLREGATQAGVNLIDKKGQDYEEPVVAKPKVESFTGAGHSLGASSAAPVVASVAAASSPAAGTGEKARVQIRLANGKALRGNFTTDQTIGDIRRYIDSQAPQSRAYDLVIPYPRAVLANLNQTILEADINGASISQQLK